MIILELKTGLFPDAESVTAAVQSLNGTHTVERLDVTGLTQDDKEGWARVATAILTAELVVTL